MSDWLPHERHMCSDCGALEGQLHERGCDMERCPFCLGQLIGCACSYKRFYPGYDDRLVHDLRTQYEEALRAGFPSVHPTHGLPQEVYDCGLPEAQAQEWERLLAEKGRVPYIVTPSLCARCGQVWPEMFHADDWDDVVPADVRRKMLCRACYEVVRALVLLGRQEATGRL